MLSNVPLAPDATYINNQLLVGSTVFSIADIIDLLSDKILITVSSTNSAIDLPTGGLTDLVITFFQYYSL